MKALRSPVYVVILVVAQLALYLPTSPEPTVAHSQQVSSTARTIPPERTGLASDLNSSSVMFIENVGQFDPGARFQVRGGDRTIWLADDAIWVSLLDNPTATQNALEREVGVPFFARDREEEEAKPRRGVNVRISFSGANPHPQGEPFDRLDTHVSFFIGNDPEKWHPEVPVWGGVRYRDLYPGIDLEVTSRNGQVSQHLIARPEADLGMVALDVDGADTISVEQGHLRITTVLGDSFLLLFQVVGTDGAPLSLTSEKSVLTGNTITLPFAGSGLGATALPKTIDVSAFSSLIYATFLGGSEYDAGFGIAADAGGAAYVTGEASSYDFPTTPDAFDTTFNGGWVDAFIIKLNRTGSALAYATLLGGSLSDGGSAIALDGNGAAYVTGRAGSGFPTTAGAYDTSYNGAGDAFVAKVSPQGSALLYATYLGGANWEVETAIVVDGSGSAYLTGQTESADFQATAGAYDTSFSGPSDAFVAKLNPAGSTLVYATFLGGSSSDGGSGIALDENGVAYVTEYTESSNFPVITGAYDTSYNGGGDAFVIGPNPVGTALLFATFLGGSGVDGGAEIAVDGNGQIYVSGGTSSADFPATDKEYDTRYGGGQDFFVARLGEVGSSLLYATFMGGSDDELFSGMAVDTSGMAYTVGTTYSNDFPASGGAYDTSHNGGGDAFLAKLSPTVYDHTVYLPITVRYYAVGW